MRYIQYQILLGYFRIVLGLFLSVITVNTAFAQKESEEIFRGIFLNTLNKLEVIGVSRIDGIPISKIKQDARTVQVSVKPYVSYSEEDSYRSSGFWIKEKNLKLISLSLHHLNQLEDGIYGANAEVMIMHEFFGPLGIQDNNFSISAQIRIVFLLIHQQESNIKNNLPITIIKSLGSLDYFKKDIQVARGGTSGVGGGGDYRIMDYMSLIYTELFFLIDRKIVSEAKFDQAMQKLKVLDIQFDASIPQSRYKYDKISSNLRIPSNPNTHENIDSNIQAVKTFLKELMN